MRLIIFDVRGELGHFRRPDTMGTQATYPFITRTALRGLVAAILGLESIPPEVRCGVRLLAPVRTVAQEMTMHGKSWISGGDEKNFHRPTAIEFVVRPDYRIYYIGPLAEDLDVRLQAGRSHYHTYLGSAYCLTFPKWVATLPEADQVRLSDSEPTTCISVVPSLAVKRLLPKDGHEYARVGGVLWEHLGGRKFRGTTSLLYEISGGSLEFFPVVPIEESPWNFYQVPGEGSVCLW